jgi:hypothetical protein
VGLRPLSTVKEQLFQIDAQSCVPVTFVGGERTIIPIYVPALNVAYTEDTAIGSEPRYIASQTTVSPSPEEIASSTPCVTNLDTLCNSRMVCTGGDVRGASRLRQSKSPRQGVGSEAVRIGHRLQSRDSHNLPSKGVVGGCSLDNRVERIAHDFSDSEYSIMTSVTVSTVS